jgi:trimeric autotransporter adhesin
MLYRTPTQTKLTSAIRLCDEKILATRYLINSENNNNGSARIFSYRPDKIVVEMDTNSLSKLSRVKESDILNDESADLRRECDIFKNKIIQNRNYKNNILQNRLNNSADINKSSIRSPSFTVVKNSLIEQQSQSADKKRCSSYNSQPIANLNQAVKRRIDCKANSANYANNSKQQIKMSQIENALASVLDDMKQLDISANPTLNNYLSNQVPLSIVKPKYDSFSETSTSSNHHSMHNNLYEESISGDKSLIELNMSSMSIKSSRESDKSSFSAKLAKEPDLVLDLPINHLKTSQTDNNLEFSVMSASSYLKNDNSILSESSQTKARRISLDRLPLSSYLNSNKRPRIKMQINNKNKKDEMNSMTHNNVEKDHLIDSSSSTEINSNSSSDSNLKIIKNGNENSSDDHEKGTLSSSLLDTSFLTKAEKPKITSSNTHSFADLELEKIKSNINETLSHSKLKSSSECINDEKELIKKSATEIDSQKESKDLFFLNNDHQHQSNLNLNNKLFSSEKKSSLSISNGLNQAEQTKQGIELTKRIFENNKFNGIKNGNIVNEKLNNGNKMNESHNDFSEMITRASSTSEIIDENIARNKTAKIITNFEFIKHMENNTTNKNSSPLEPNRTEEYKKFIKKQPPPIMKKPEKSLDILQKLNSSPSKEKESVQSNLVSYSIRSNLSNNNISESAQQPSNLNKSSISIRLSNSKATDV